jgi:hypothetical protein
MHKSNNLELIAAIQFSSKTELDKLPYGFFVFLEGENSMDSYD